MAANYCLLVIALMAYPARYIAAATATNAVNAVTASVALSVIGVSIAILKSAPAATMPITAAVVFRVRFISLLAIVE